MKLLKTVTLVIGSLLSFAPISTTIACSNANLLYLSPHLYLVDKNIQDSASRKHVDLSQLEFKNMDKLSPNISGIYDSKTMSGGWAEWRNFYNEGKGTKLHIGIDVFTDANTQILSPSNAQIIASYWLGLDKSYAEGVGGISILKIPIANLEIKQNLKDFVYIYAKTGTKSPKKFYKVPKLVFSDNELYEKPKNIATKKEYEDFLNNTLDSCEKDEWIENSKYIYISIIHQSKSSIKILKSKNIKEIVEEKANRTWIINTNIDFKNPQNLSKGELFGTVGKPEDNGGWVPHMHVETYYNLALSQNSIYALRNLKKYSFKDKDKDSDILRMLWSVKPKGTLVKKNIFKNDPKKYLLNKGLFNPNNIFNFYNDKDETVILK